MDEEYDATELGRLADERIQSFQADSSQVKPADLVSTLRLPPTVAQCLNIKIEAINFQGAGIFHHLITLPTYHTAALSTDQLAKG